MKTCKKILAGVLVLAIMLSMCAFVSADETTETETPATSVPLIKYTFDTAEVTNSVTISDLAREKLVGNALGGSSVTYGSNGILTAAVVEKAEGDKYISTKGSLIGNNFRQTDTALAAYDAEGAYPVMGISYDIMIPADDDYKNNLRNGSFPIGTSTTGSCSSTAMVSTVAPKIKDGKAFAGVASTNAKYTKEIDYTYGEWLTFDIRAWLDDSGKLAVAVFADDELIYYGLSEKTAVGLAGRDWRLAYANSPDGETRVAGDATYTWKNGILQSIKVTDDEGNTTVSTDVPETITSTTCYDNYNVALYPEASKVSDAEVNALIAAQKAATPEVAILEFSGADLASTAGTKAKAVFTSTGDLTTSIVQGGNTDEHTADAYEVIEDENGNYTNLTSTSYKLLVGNVRGSFDDWVRKGVGDKSTFVYSTDMMVSNFNAKVVGRISLGLDMMSGDVKDADGNVILKENKAGNATITYTIGTDGKIEFVNSVATNHAYVPSASVVGAERSETRDVTAGDWFNVKFIFEITHGATQYEIKVYGVFEDDVIYEDEFTITYTDYDNDGVSDDIHVGQFDYTVGVDNTTHEETVTSFRSMSFVKNNNFDWSAIDTDAWINRTINVTKDEAGNVDVYAKKGEGTFTNETLVIAICNANGTVKEVLTSKAVAENGTMSYEVPASKVVAGNIVKAFVFDSLTSAKPQMANGSYIVE